MAEDGAVAWWMASELLAKFFGGNGGGSSNGGWHFGINSKHFNWEKKTIVVFWIKYEKFNDIMSHELKLYCKIGNESIKRERTHL